MNIDTSQKSRPIIATTTVDLVEKMRERTATVEHQLTIVDQFKRRLTVIDLREEKICKQFKVMTFGSTKYLTARYQCYCFWEAYRGIEE